MSPILLSLAFLLLFFVSPPTTKAEEDVEASSGQVFSTYDLDTNGTLDSFEMHQLFVDIFPISLFNTTSRNKVAPRTLDKLFVMLDIDGDGSIDSQEFRKIWLFWLKPLLQPKSVLILLNVQNDYVQKDGKKYVQGAEQIVTNLNALLVRNRFEKILLVNDFNRLDRHRTEHNMPTALNFKPSFDGQVLKVISKHNTSQSALYDEGAKLPLYYQLDELRPKSDYILYLAGFYHDTDVMATALDAYDLNFPVVLLREATLMSSNDRSEKSRVERHLASHNIVAVSTEDVKALTRGEQRKIETGLMLANKFYRKYARARTTTAAPVFEEPKEDADDHKETNDFSW